MVEGFECQLCQGNHNFWRIGCALGTNVITFVATTLCTRCLEILIGLFVLQFGLFLRQNGSFVMQIGLFVLWIGLFVKMWIGLFVLQITGDWFICVVELRFGVADLFICSVVWFIYVVDWFICTAERFILSEY